MAYTKASQALRIAFDKYGMSNTTVAELCDVSAGSVKRWMLTGRADEKAIQPLLRTIGPVYLSEGQIADHLGQLYRSGTRRNRKGINVRRFIVTAKQMENIAGRQYLPPEMKSAIRRECRERGYILEEGTDDYIMVSWKWVYEGCAPIADDEIPEFYEELADIDEDDPDE